MSPKPLAHLEGEQQGPDYGSFANGEIRAETSAAEEQVAPQGQQTSDVMSEVKAGPSVDGLDTVRGQGPAQTADPARVQSSASSVLPQQQQIFTDVTLPVRDRLPTQPQQLPEQHHVAEHVHQRVIMEGMTFSPPEELPSHDHGEARAGHGSSGGQPAWFMRFGEYLQKRVTPAGSMMSPLLDPAPRTPTASYPTVTTPTQRTPNPPQPRLFTAAAEQRMKQWVRQAPLLYGQPNNGSGSSPESLTQEQVVAEVQKRVQQKCGNTLKGSLLWRQRMYS